MRWAGVLAVLGCAAVGLFLLARPWRPGPRASDGHANREHKPQPSAPAPAKPEVLVAEAKGVAAELLRALPGEPPAMALAGRIHYAFSDVANAEKCWQACLSIDPEFAEALCCLGETAWEHGKFDKAAERLKKAFAANPRLDQKRVFILADALMNLGESQEAAAALERAAKESPLPPFGLFLLGHAYLGLNEYEKARDQFEAVLAVDPRSANAHFSLITVYNRLGQPEKSRTHKEQYATLRKDELAESARLRPQMRKMDWADPYPVVRECHLNAGKIYALYGKAGEAEKHWLRAAAIDPQNPEPRKLLELLYRQQGRQEEAVQISPGPMMNP